MLSLMTEPKKVVVWGTGFVGKMVIPEIVRHPNFELIGVGVHDKDKVGRDVGEICGIGPLGLDATDDLDALIALRPDALVHYGPTADTPTTTSPTWAPSWRRDRRLLDGDDAVGLAPHAPEPSLVDRPDHGGLRRGRRHLLHHRHRPGLCQRPLPHDTHGALRRGKKVKALEILDYLNYTGAYEDEMGIGRPPEFTPLLEHTDILVMSWGATVPMMAHAVGIELDEITTTWEKWVTDAPITTAKGVINPGEVAAIHFTINGIYRGEPRICLEHVNRVGTDAAPDWPRGTQDDVYRVEIEGSPSITQETAFRFTDGWGRDAAAAGCLATGLRALNAVPPSTTFRRVGHRAGSAADPRGGDHPLSGSASLDLDKELSSGGLRLGVTGFIGLGLNVTTRNGSLVHVSDSTTNEIRRWW